MKRLKHLSLIIFFFLAACVTVNIYFPAAAIQKAADKIVDEISGGDDEQMPGKDPDIRSLLLDRLKGFNIGPKEAYAQLDINISTPAIRSVRGSMRETFRQLRPFYAGGVIGENKDGFVEVRDTSSLTLKEKADAARLVEQQNKDRATLYSEIVKANKLDNATIPQVQKIFADSWRGKSRSGWFIKNDSGEWERKE